MTIEKIYEKAKKLINQFISKESASQGHYLTGALENSLTAEISSTGDEDTMEGFAVYYAKFVDEGFPAQSASFKQWPFLVDYFQKRGLGEKEAKAAAAATIRVWMKEGMPTEGSKKYSTTGSRLNMIEDAISKNESKLDTYMTRAFDDEIEKKFQKNKSETI